jgi:hypothetical protein
MYTVLVAQWRVKMYSNGYEYQDANEQEPTHDLAHDTEIYEREYIDNEKDLLHSNKAFFARLGIKYE